MRWAASGTGLATAVAPSVLLLMAGLPAPVWAGPILPGFSAPRAAIEQRLGAELPLRADFVDSEGVAVHLADFFADAGARRAVPVVLVLGYYRCKNLCETVMQGTLESLAQSGVPRSDYRVVAISIDPGETPEDARARRSIDVAYADLAASRWSARGAAGEALDLHELVGAAGPVGRLASSVGFSFERVDGDKTTAAASTFAHAAGFMIATPDGRISRYFLGVRHDPVALRDALDDAAGDSIGAAADRLLLLCAHLNPTLGRFSATVLLALRMLGLGLAATLGLWVWRHRDARATEDTEATKA